MCNWVTVKDMDGTVIAEEVDTIGELKAYLPMLVAHRAYDPAIIEDSPDSCLCPLDLKASAAASGYNIKTTDFIVYTLTKREG